MDTKYTLTVGLEIHAELSTASKMWCGCANDPFAGDVNAHVCPICMGHPGTLPVANKKAVEAVVRVGVAVGGTIADFTEFDRKNYFYPDIPKGYQISQYKYPLVSGGSLAGVALTRIHLEEDTATSIHEGNRSLVNYNRAGVPLMELVTEPVIHSPEAAGAFARELQTLLRTLGAGDANMERGEMRVEANISIAPEGSTTLGTKVEVKNINSFKAVEKAIAFEYARHMKALAAGEEIVQETRGWDDVGQRTFSQRKKESSHDYRYFPEPDLPKLHLSKMPEFAVETVRAALPELPWQRRERYTKDFTLHQDQVEQFIQNLELAALFDAAAEQLKEPKLIVTAANYITSDVVSLCKDGAALPSAGAIVELVSMIAANELSSRGAKDVLAIVIAEGGMPKAIANEKGLIQKSDRGALEAMAREIIAAHETAVTEYKAGKEASLQFLIGQGMKASKGSANPSLLKEIFVSLLQ